LTLSRGLEGLFLRGVFWTKELPFLLPLDLFTPQLTIVQSQEGGLALDISVFFLLVCVLGNWTMTFLERHVLRRYDTRGRGFLLVLVFVIFGFLRRAKHCHMLFQHGTSGGVLMGTSNGNVPCLFGLSFCKGGGLESFV